MSIQIQQTKYEAIPSGIYQASIKDIQQEQGKFGPQLRITFELSRNGDEPKTLIGFTSLRFSPKSKLYEWTESIIGQIPPSYNFDSDDLLGKEVNLVVGQKTGTDGNTYNPIENVKPVNKKPEQPPSAVHLETEAPE